MEVPKSLMREKTAHLLHPPPRSAPLHRPSQILFRLFVGLHNIKVVMQWVDYYLKIL